MSVFSKEKYDWARAQEDRSRSGLSKLILSAYKYRVLRRFCFEYCYRIEGGIFFSRTHRDILLKYHGVTVGKYSYGPCLEPGVMPRGSIVGSYCSFGSGLNVFRRNHPGDTLTQHPFFYNRFLGLVDQDTIPNDQDNPLEIGNDVWIGSRTTILPGCRKIGNGAIIGAGSVVTKDVDAFTVVGGNPARMLKKRFSAELEEIVEQSSWWDLSLPELLKADDLLLEAISQEKMETFINGLEQNVKSS